MTTAQVTFSAGKVCLVISLICFVLAFIGIGLSGHSLSDLGLAFLAAAFLI